MNKLIKTQLCVVGGGLSGVCCAISAARLGLKVVLVQDRNVLGGNASSEVRMWVRGAGYSFHDYAEGGIIHELALDNIYYNPHMNFYLWDGVILNKVLSEPNITLLLGCSCIDAHKKGNSIDNITVWELASYTKYTINAKYFADCSGDCIFAEFIDAKYRQGRESKYEFNEILAESTKDNFTMGNSCLLQLKNSPVPTEHTPFPFECKQFEKLCNNRCDIKNINYDFENFWWLELGGDKDALKNAGEINKDLLSMNYALYSYILKNNEITNKNLSLDWLGSIAGKRETRRYVGDYILTQNDIESAVKFEDEIAYGGWGLDNHCPKGIYADRPNHNKILLEPYSIPYRCIYSKNIDNLFFAGRNISVSHMALSSTRVMGTCSILGQAVGVASYIANKYDLSVREIGKHIKEVQQILLVNDCLLLNNILNESTKWTKTNKDISIIKNTPQRKLGTEDRVLVLEKKEELVLECNKVYCKKIRLVFDSDFAREEEKEPLRSFPMVCFNYDGKCKATMPKTLVKDFIIKIKINDEWITKEIQDNHQRLVFIDVNKEVEGVKFIGVNTYGSKDIRLYSIELI